MSHPFIVSRSLFGERHAACGALQQACAEMFFQPIDGLADGRCTKTKIFGCACDGAGFDHFDKAGNCR